MRDYTSGRKVPGLDASRAIAEAGGVTVDWLATGRGPRRRTAPEAASAPIPGRRWAKLIELVEGIDDDQKRAAVLDDLFARAQDFAEREALRQAVAELRATLKKQA